MATDIVILSIVASAAILSGLAIIWAVSVALDFYTLVRSVIRDWEETL